MCITTRNNNAEKIIFGPSGPVDTDLELVEVLPAPGMFAAFARRCCLAGVGLASGAASLIVAATVDMSTENREVLFAAGGVVLLLSLCGIGGAYSQRHGRNMTARGAGCAEHHFVPVLQ